MLTMLTLIEPSAAYQDAFYAMIDDFLAAGETSYREGEFQYARRDFEGYVQQQHRQTQGLDLPPGHVPQSTFWLLKDGGEIVGTIRIRHRLTTLLAHHGGHIGYDIRPSARRQGYGMQQLALALDKARAIGLTRVMLTCDVINIASARIIEANGGVLESQGLSDLTHQMISRYWITL